MSRVRVLLSLMALLAVATTAAAQDAGRIGFVANTAESLGVIWGVSEKLAVRGGMDFSHLSSETELSDIFPSLGVDRSTSTVGLQLSALIGVGRWDDLKAYVAPGYGRNWRSGDDNYDTSNYQLEGMFGLQYALGSRFRVFGEAGISYVHTRIEQDVFGVLGGPAEDFGEGDIAVTTSGIGSASRVGVIFYFK